MVGCTSRAVGNGDGARIGCCRFTIRFKRSICESRIGSRASGVWVSSLTDSQCDLVAHAQAIVGGRTVQLGGGGFESDNHTFRVPDALSVSGNEVDPAGLSVTTGTLRTQKIPEPGDVLGILLGGTVAFGLKRQLSKKKPTTTA